MPRRSLAVSFASALLLAACATPGPPAWTPLPAAQLDHALTLEECVQLAVDNDIRAAQWKARHDGARAELTSARTLPNPTFGASWEDLGIRDAEGVPLKNATYGFSYPVLFFVTRGKQIDVAKRRLAAEQAAVNADQRDLTIEIGAAYFSILADQRRESSLDDLAEQARDGVRLAQESYKVGSVSGHDVEVAEADLLQAEADLFDAHQVTLRDRLVFGFALGADRPVTVEIQDRSLELSESLAGVNTDAVPDGVLQQALEVDPAYASARSNREAAESLYQLELRRIIPLTDVQAGGAVKDAPEGTAHNFSLDTPIPLLDWNRGGVKRARADLLAAQAEEERTRRAVVEQLSRNWLDYRSARTRYEEFSVRIAADRARLAGDAQDLFAAGQIPYIELIQARSDWQQAELAAADSWRDSQAAAWELLNRTNVE